MNIIRTRFKEFFSLWRNYSFTLAFYNIVWWFCFYTHIPFSYKISTFAIRKKTIWLDKYIKNNYSDIIDKYIGRTQNTEKIEQVYIWVFWGQGEESMPALVKACYKQLTQYNKNVILLTYENIADYIVIEDTVNKKVKSGQISWAYFSDIIRNTILAKYGGLWVDATTWIPQKIPFDTLMEYKFFSPAENSYINSCSVQFWSTLNLNWNGWCMWSNCKDYIIFSFVAEMLTEIAKREKTIPDYVTIDYLIYLGTRLFPCVVTDFKEAKKITCNNRHELAKRMNKPFCLDEYCELIKDNFIFKLSYRTKWKKETAEGVQTFYGRILSGVI